MGRFIMFAVAAIVGTGVVMAQRAAPDKPEQPSLEDLQNLRQGPSLEDLRRLQQRGLLEWMQEDTRLRNAQTLVANENALRLEKAAFLGVSTSPVPAALREQLRLPGGFGLLVDHVEKGSPAEAAGVKQYDVLHKLDDQILINAQQMAALIRSHKAGDEIKLSVIHQGQPAVLPVKLAEKEVRPLEETNPWMIPPKFFQETEQDIPLGDFMKNMWVPAAKEPADKRIEFALPNTPTTRPFDGLEQYINRALSDGQVNVEITIRSGEPATLTLKDKLGQTILQVPLVGEDHLKMLPPEIRRSLNKLIAPEGHEGGGVQKRQDKSGAPRADERKTIPGGI